MNWPGSFTYCDFIKCPQIYAENLPERNELEEIVTNVELRSEYPNYLHATHPESIMFGLDLTCNLACPQCRPHQIVERSSEQLYKYEKAVTELMPLLRKARVLTLNPSGEVFASKVCRSLLSKLNSEEYPDLELGIMTNGTLFSRREWENYPGIHDMVRFVRISIDAATSETYRDIRVGGDFDMLQTNILFLSELREANIIKELEFLFVYQQRNFHEMVAFAEWGKLAKCDLVIFQKLHFLPGSGYSIEEVERRSVYKIEHPDNSTFRTVLRELERFPDLISIDDNYGANLNSAGYQGLSEI